MNSYQHGYTASSLDSDSENDISITNLDDLGSTDYNLKNNFLSNFNFISSSNNSKSRQIKYYVAIAIAIIILIIVLSDITSSSSSSNIQSPISPISDKSKEESICDEPDYFKKVLKEEYTQIIGGILKNVEGTPKYEASGVVYDESRDSYWVVFDSLYAIAKLSSNLMRTDKNTLVVSHDNHINDNIYDIESGYEGITRDPDTDIFYLLTESVKFKDNDDKTVYHPVVTAATYDDNEMYTETQICASDFEAASGNKGFEGFNLITIGGTKYFVGLCEGNYCESGDKGKESGNGRIVLLEFAPTTLIEGNAGDYEYLVNIGINCIYKVIDTFKLPDYIDFIDYSGIHFKACDGGEGVFNLAITSQESAAVWVGVVRWTSVGDGPNFDLNEDGDEQIFQFPKEGDCQTVFCNVEGIQFINDDQFVVVSDEAKNKGKQPWICGAHDQSITIFKLPPK